MSYPLLEELINEGPVVVVTAMTLCLSAVVSRGRALETARRALLGLCRSSHSGCCAGSWTP